MIKSAAVAVLFAAASVTYGQQDNRPLNPASVAGDLVQAKTEVYTRVVDLKKKFATNPQADQLTQGKAFYDKALGAYSNWTTTLHLAILNGSVKNLRNDADYKAKTAAAGKASGDFINYVEKQTGGSKALFAFASDAATIGIKIWNAVKDRQKQERTEFVAEFDKLVKWDDWDTVGAPPKTDGSGAGVNQSKGETPGGKQAPAADGKQDKSKQKNP